MYERFTDLARSVVKTANEEAERLRCDRLGTEHLLLALLQQDSGAAAQVLTNLNVDRRKLRTEMEGLAQAAADGQLAGGAWHSPQLGDVIECAMEEARAFHHNYVGTEHILLGLFCDEQGPVAGSLRDAGLTADGIRSQVRKLVGEGFNARSDENRP